MEKGAILDNTKKYRYELWRKWDLDKPGITFIMLNPSTADHTEDDSTIKKCIKFSKRWGYGQISVVNLFAYRATKPEELKGVTDPVGRENNQHLQNVIDNSQVIVAAWGVEGKLHGRNIEVDGMLRSKENVYCLGTTKEGHPMHPLYLSDDTELILFSKQ